MKTKHTIQQTKCTIEPGLLSALRWIVVYWLARLTVGDYAGYDVYAAATAPIAEEVDDLTPDEEIAIDMREEEIDEGEIDSETERKVFSMYLPFVSR